MSEYVQRYPMRDGGHAEWDPSVEISDMVTVGDMRVTSEIRVHHDGGYGQPQVDMLIEIIDGVPMATELTLRAGDESREVRTKDLRAIPIEDWIEEAVQGAAWSPNPAGGHRRVFSVNGRDPGKVRQVQNARAGSRRKVTPELLEEVARLYRMHFEDSPVDRIATAFQVSERTAARYVQLCRRDGILPPTTPGKKAK